MSKSQPQSQTQPQKRRPIDFSKPYTKSVPVKRLSPTPMPESNSDHDRISKKPKQAPKTPVDANRFVDLAVSPLKSPFALGHSPRLPIRSPRPKEQNTPSSLRSNLFSSPLRRPPAFVEPPTQFSLADTASSGRSLFKNGKVVVVGDSDEDDSESLESLEDLFGRTLDSNTSSSSPPEEESRKENKRPSVLDVFLIRERQAIVGKERLRDILAKEQLHKFDISKLIHDHLDDADTKKKLDQANSSYEASARLAKLQSNASSDDQKLLRDLIDGKGGDEDEVTRVLTAMDRTGALTTETSFSFFGYRDFKDVEVETTPERSFPAQDILQDLPSLCDPSSRSRTYLSGEVEEMAINGQLPDSLLMWTFESIALECKVDLREAYIQCLAQASRQWTRTNLTARNIQDVFLALGADSTAIRDGVNIVPNREQINRKRCPDPENLLSVLEVFHAVSEDLDFESLSKLSSILVRLSLDDEAMDDSRTLTAVEDLLSRLLQLPKRQSRFHVAERILIDMHTNLKDNYLQARVLRHILPNSALGARLRLVLAQCFLFLDHVQSLDLSEPPTISLPSLLQYLRSSTFDLNHRPDDDPVNYIELAALTQVLDTGISDGGPPSIFLNAAEEKAFNRQVDELADRVHTIFSSIADTGASHMRRTEAKEALGVLEKRLLYSVRTKPRPKKSVFGGHDEEEYRSEERSKSAMQKYLKSKEKTVLKDEGDSDTPESSSETKMLIRRQLGLSP